MPYYQRDGVQGEHPQQPFKDDFKHSQWFLKSMQNGKFTNTYGLCKPATLWFLVAFGSSLNAVARCSCFWSCTCFQPEGTMFLQQFFWLVQEAQTYYIDEPRKSTINRISNHIIHLTSPIPPAFALVLQPKRHFWFLRSSETQAHWGSWGHPRPFANWYPFKLGDGWHMLTPLWPALVPYYKICISPNWGTPKRFGFPPKKTTTHDNKLDALGV